MTGSPLPVRGEGRLLENRFEGGASWRMRLGVSGWPGFAPGQFVMLSPGARPAAPRFDPLLPRPMAVFRELARGTDGAEIEILYKVTGRGTHLLSEARPEERVGVVGPLGSPFPLPEPGERAVLVGGGTGIASLYELAARARERARVEVTLGARSAAELMGVDAFRELGISIALVTEDGSAGEAGLVTHRLESLLEGGEVGIVYACGPTAMMRRAAELAAASGVRCLVSLENHMACGFGVCLGCAVPRSRGGYALVCREGPVFEADGVDWKGLP